MKDDTLQKNCIGNTLKTTLGFSFGNRPDTKYVLAQ